MPRAADRNTSAFVRMCMQKLIPHPSSWALDLACGRGRHSLLLAASGFNVCAVDIDTQSLLYIHETLRNIDEKCHLAVYAVRADATKPLPFVQNAFSVCVIVDYVAPGMFAQVCEALVPGGILIYETYGAHGENWRLLPTSGQMQEELGGGFDVLTYRERKVGPASADAVVVKLLAAKRAGSVSG